MSTTAVSPASPARPNPPSFADEILTTKEVAQMLKMSVRQIWEMTRSRGQLRMANPIPTLKINGNVRFSRRGIEEWLQRVAQERVQ